MAIYHLRASVISRSAGRSATAAAAYRSAAHIEDRRTGLCFDYSKRGGVDHVEILAPEHAPEWATDRAELWNRVEEAETRKNSQVAREIRVALPAELTHAQRVELVRDFCQREFVDRGMVADIALHAPGRDGDDRNHHAHILLTTREIGPEGFEAKNRGWNAVEMLEGWRKAWAQESNRALERSGIEDRIDHRTLVAQRDEALERADAARERGDEREALRETVRAVALDRPPLPQLSPGAWQLKERGIEVAAVRVWQEVRERSAEVAKVAKELAGHVREWLGRTAERLVPESALDAGGASVAAQRIARFRERADKAREIWAARQGQAQKPERARAAEPYASTREPEAAAQSLADRLRAAAQGMDKSVLAEAAARLREGREAEDRHRAEIERQKTQEKQREQAQKVRDRGSDYGL
ncbi:MobQ family relaxase [Falsirhodobacter sp. 1013]|uniref:MobQ family relaxase n=1 Tax=Falsirhodobacter sp. 1013 TaxID=3417566 RepID=UPI003EC0BACC